jgi:hypothetical protein
MTPPEPVPAALAGWISADDDPSAADPRRVLELEFARTIAGDIAVCNLGAVRTVVHALEQGAEAARPDPWRLLERVAELVIRDRASQIANPSGR